MNKSRFLNDDGRDVFLYADRLSDEEIERLAQLQSSGKIEGRIFSPVSGTPLIVKRHSVELIELGYVKCWFACKPGMATPLDRMWNEYSKNESEEHRGIKWLYHDECTKQGLKTDVEHALDDRSGIADVWVEGSKLGNGHPVALEIQLSHQTPPDYRERTRNYLDNKVEVIWLGGNLQPEQLPSQSDLWNEDFDLPLMGNATRLPMRGNGWVFYENEWHRPALFVRDVLQGMFVRNVDVTDRLGQLATHLYGEPEGRPAHMRAEWKKAERKRKEEEARLAQRRREADKAWDYTLRKLGQLLNNGSKWLSADLFKRLKDSQSLPKPESVGEIERIVSERGNLIDEASREHILLWNRQHEIKRMIRISRREQREHDEWKAKWEEYGRTLPERQKREREESEKGWQEHCLEAWRNETRHAADPEQQKYLDTHPLIGVTPTRFAVCPRCKRQYALVNQNEHCKGMARLYCYPSQKKRKGHWSCPFCFQVLAEYEGPVEPLRIPIERIPPNLIRPTWKSRHSDKPPQTEGSRTRMRKPRYNRSNPNRPHCSKSFQPNKPEK